MEPRRGRTGQPVIRLLAQLVLLTRLVDRAYRFFDRARSTIVLALGSDRFFDTYNEVAYNNSRSYSPDRSEFRRGLFDWEKTVVEEWFPAAPARILVGGAGGGREALALVERGYPVTAFDPADHLVRAMRGASASTHLRAYVGDYRALPLVHDTVGSAVNLSNEPVFDAGIFGWASFSHLRSDAERIAALQAFSRLVHGPVLVSYFPDPSTSPVTVGEKGGVRGWLRRRALRNGRTVFSVQVGYYRLMQHAEMVTAAEAAGLHVVMAAPDENFPYVVLRRQ